MKKIIQEVLIYAFALHVTSLIFAGLVIKGGILNYIIAGALLALGFKLLKPIILTIALPLHILTLGLVSPIITVLTLFVLTKVVWFVDVKAFVFSGTSIFGYSLPSFSASIILSFIILSVTISLVASLIRFVFSK